jgi:PPOX class probable F420-dependent enzyme
MDDALRVRLAQGEVAWLTTVAGDGAPQSSPVWFVWHDGAFHVASEQHAAKIRNIAGNPMVALHLDGAGAGELVVTVEGAAALTAGVPGPAYAEKYARGFARLGTDAPSYLARFSAGLRVEPTRWRVFPSE